MSFDLCIGIIFSIFSWFGTNPVLKEDLKIRKSGLDIIGATILRNFVDIPSKSSEVLGLSFRMASDDA